MKHVPPAFITGYSLINALGCDIDEFERRLWNGESAVRSPASLTGAKEGRVAHELLPLPAEHAAYDSRSARLLWAALSPLAADIEVACQRWGHERVAVIVGSSTGGIESSERAFQHYQDSGELPGGYSFFATHAFDTLVRLAEQACALGGPGYVISSACSSSAKALASAQRLLALGVADAVLAIGVDSLCATTRYGFQSLGIVSQDRAQPFALARDGINLGEGAACLLLERAGPAAFQLLGAGESSDAYHLSSPHPEGRGALLAMQRALLCAQLTPDQIDYVNAHGTGTELNDRAEALATKQLFLRQIPVSSTKAATGHLLGAAGATEAIVCLSAIDHSQIPANLVASEIDAALGVRVVTSTVSQPVRAALSNSFAFGGSNVSLVLAATPATAAPVEQRPNQAIEVVATAAWTEGQGPPPAAILPARVRGRASTLSRMFAEVFEHAVQKSGFAADTVAIVCGSAFGELETMLELLKLQLNQTSSPVRFQASVHNTAVGMISMATNNQNFSTAIAAGADTVSMALMEAQAWLLCHGGEAIVIVGDESIPEEFSSKRYAPLAVAFALRAVPSGIAAVELGLPHRARRAVAFARPQAAQASGSFNPCAPALELMQRIEQRVGGEVELPSASDLAWTVDLVVR